jgi:hypothetical protein
VYLIGGFGISMIAGVMVLFVLKDVGANKRSSVPPGIEIAVGALLLLCAVLVGTGLSARLLERVQTPRSKPGEGRRASDRVELGTDPVVAARSTIPATAEIDSRPETQSDIGEKLASLEGRPVLRKLVPPMRRALETESPGSHGSPASCSACQARTTSRLSR